MDETSEMVMVTDMQVLAAYHHFLEVFHPNAFPSTYGKGLSFWQFVGHDTDKFKPMVDGYMVEQAVFDKIQKMAGPHYHAVCKAMEANGAEWKFTEQPA